MTRAVRLKLSYRRTAPWPTALALRCAPEGQLLPCRAFTQFCNKNQTKLKFVHFIRHTVIWLFLGTFMQEMEMIKSKAFWDTRYPRIWWIVISFWLCLFGTWQRPPGYLRTLFGWKNSLLKQTPWKPLIWTLMRSQLVFYSIVIWRGKWRIMMNPTKSNSCIPICCLKCASNRVWVQINSMGSFIEFGPWDIPFVMVLQSV